MEECSYTFTLALDSVCENCNRTGGLTSLNRNVSPHFNVNLLYFHQGDNLSILAPHNGRYDPVSGVYFSILKMQCHSLSFSCFLCVVRS